MKTYTYLYSYVNVTEISFDEISRIDVVKLGEPTESPLAWYTRQQNKPAVLTNGGFFNVSNGTPAMALVDEGKTLSTSSVPSGMSITGDKTIALCPKTGKERDYVSAYPVLIENGKAAAITYAKEIDYKARRTVYAWDSIHLFVITVDSPGMNFAQLQAMLLGMGVINAVNLDGGGSTVKVVDGKRVSAGTYIRAVDNAIAVYTKAKPFKIVLAAGHYKYTSGKRCLKSLDPNETTEWWLNDRVCDHVEDALKDYDGYELIRADDTLGEIPYDNDDRVKAANEFDADVYLSVHHNAGINGGSGGGIVCYCHPYAGKVTEGWRDELYDALVRHTGLKGNRATPKTTADYYELRETDMDAVLMELGFMDSKTDVPIILTDEYAQQCAAAIVEVLVKRGNLVKKPEPAADVRYRVQVGSFKNKDYADRLMEELKAKGYQAYMVRVEI